MICWRKSPHLIPKDLNNYISPRPISIISYLLENILEKVVDSTELNDIFIILINSYLIKLLFLSSLDDSL